MTNWDLKQRFIFLLILPLALLTLVLTSFFTYQQITFLNESLNNRGNLLSQDLAVACSDGLTKNDTELLQPILDSAILGEDVDAVSIINTKGSVILRAQKKNSSDNLSAKPTSFSNSNLIYMKPILTSDKELLETVKQFSKNVVSGSEKSHLSIENENVVGWVIIELTTARVSKQIFLLSFRNIGVSLAVLFIGILIAGGISNKITTPILRLSEAANQIEKGTLDIYIDSGAKGELKTLEGSINNMAASLRLSRDDLQERIDQATTDLLNSLQVVERQNSELIATRQQAILASKVKSEFLANMSHEIRTPMNGILGFIKLLKGSNPNGEQLDYIDTIEKSSNNLLKIINDILDISKIEAGKIHLLSVEYNFRELVDEVIAFLAPSAYEKDINLVSIYYSDVPLILKGDMAKVRQILTNLIANAIKFTDQGSVVIRTMLEDRFDDKIEIKVSVTDTGIGISDNDQHRLFATFEQADGTMNRKYGGTGLGLAISKTLTELMHGTIGMDSEIDIGSTFWFTFTHTEIDSNIAIDTSNTDNLAQLFNNCRGLLYEANPESKLAIKHIFNSWGVGITDVSTLPDLLEQFTVGDDVSPYHIVILGLSQREMHSSKLSYYLEEIKKYSDIKIVSLVNSVDRHIHDQILGYGSDLCLTKPLKYEMTVQALHSLFVGDNDLSHDSEIIEDTFNESEVIQIEYIPQVTTKTKRQQPNNINILVAEDNEINAKLVGRLLNQIGLNPTIVANGQHAVEQTLIKPYDIILMDIQMPIMDGIEATKLIRSRESHDVHIPIIALTADAMASDVDSFLKHGMDEVLIKPIDEEKLFRLITKHTDYQHIAKTESSSNLINNHDVTVELPLADTGIGDDGYKHHNNNKNTPNKNKEVAKELFPMFVKELPTFLSQIKEAYDTDDYPCLAEHVHKLHGATSYCDVPILKNAVKNLERTIKKGKHEKIRKAIFVVYTEIDQLLERQNL